MANIGFPGINPAANASPDPLIAAAWHCAGITEISTLNPGDFTSFGQFTVFP